MFFYAADFYIIISTMDENVSNISVAIVCDCYFPQLGGVELQIKELAKYLKDKIKNVIVVTHCRPPEFYGLKIIEGVKTYYLPWFYSESNVIFATYFLQYPEARQIFIKEAINIVHVHQSASPLGMCYAIFGYFRGLKVIHTEHSLFGSSSLTDMHFNWAMTAIYDLYNKFICVSRATRNNLILRCHADSSKIIIIPNSVDKPKPTHVFRHKDGKIKIAIVSRMVYRRGIDLLIELIPIFCKRNKDISFQIIGDGPKMNPLREIVKKQQLASIVHLYGRVENKDALQIVKSCDVFLSTALTESFGIAIIQASYLGLQCISTNVGGVSQILPSHKLHIVDCNVDSIIRQLEIVIEKMRKRQQNIKQCQQDEQQYYSKQDCCQKVVKVYSEEVRYGCESKLLKIVRRIVVDGSFPGILLIIILILVQCIDGVLSLVQKVKAMYK